MRRRSAARSAASSARRRRSASTSAAADAVHAALFLIAPEAAARNVRVESQIDADARLFADPAGPAGAREPADERHPGDRKRLVARAHAHGLGQAERRRSHVRRVRHGAGHRTAIDRSAFEPFFTSKSDGMGMGPTVARSIVDAHHGRIWARGEPGAGCCFRSPCRPIRARPARPHDDRGVPRHVASCTPIALGLAHEIGKRRCIHLAHHGRAMLLDGNQAQSEMRRDLLCSVLPTTHATRSTTATRQPCHSRRRIRSTARDSRRRSTRGR